MKVTVSFVRAHRAHNRYVPSYFRADRSDGAYYTELAQEVAHGQRRDESLTAAFERNAKEHFAAVPTIQ